MKTLILIAVFVLSVTRAYADETPLDPCANLFVEVDKAGIKVTKNQVRKFLHSLNCGYFKGAEGSEFGNELLFSTLLYRPDDFILYFSELDSSTQRRIISELKAPVHDGINIKGVYKAVSGAKNNKSKAIILETITNTAKAAGIDIK